MESSIKCNQRT